MLAGAPVWAAETKGNSNVSSQDRTFVMEAASGGMAEVQLGKLAQQRGESESVKKFGQRMVDDHGKTNTGLAGIAKNAGIDLPKQPGKKHEGAVKKLEGLKGGKFDQAYAEQMVKDHETTISLFEQQAKKGQSAELKGFAEKALPALQEHLKMAKALPKG
jgi:putative membrane protein